MKVEIWYVTSDTAHGIFTDLYGSKAEAEKVAKEKLLEYVEDADENERLSELQLGDIFDYVQDHEWFGTLDSLHWGSEVLSLEETSRES